MNNFILQIKYYECTTWHDLSTHETIVEAVNAFHQEGAEEPKADFRILQILEV